VRRWGWSLACGLVLLAAGQPAVAEAGALGRLFGRGATKAPIPRGTPAPYATAKAKPAQPKNLFKQDLRNHRATPVRPLEKDRTVFRYTTKEQARQAQHKGLPPGSHMTARGGRGRPLTSDHAQSRYATPKKPDARITVHLDKGQPVRSNKVAGAPDQRRRELTSPERIPRSSIVGVTPLTPRSR
jgi:hypothetical protein